MDSEMGLADVTEDTACELHVEGRLDGRELEEHSSMRRSLAHLGTWE